MVTFPVGTIPAQLGIDMPNDITSFMLDPTQDYNEILKGWDKVAAKERK
jgi:raffinose/stachyose/melibiose transport system substrate-binding protein